MKLSVIIPALNEGATITQVVTDAITYSDNQLAEVIVVDGGSRDQTVDLARRAGAIVLTAPRPGRAAQMNHGAAHATGDVLYFVHADVRLNPSFLSDIRQAIADGFPAGRYRFRFDSNHLLLRLNSYATRFGGVASRGGDQTLFLQRDLFDKLGGFDERFVIMEDFDIITRLEQMARFAIIPKNVIVSARKYERNSWLRVQLANLMAVVLFRCRVSPNRIAKTYKQLLH